MKILIEGISLCALALVLTSQAGLGADPSVQREKLQVDIEVFVREGCQHCKAAKAFLETLKTETPSLRILFHDVRKDSVALTRLTTLAAKAGVQHPGLPTFYVREELIVGFTSIETTGEELKNILGRSPPETTNGNSAGICPLNSEDSCESQEFLNSFNSRNIDLPFFGPRTIRDLGLPLFTILLGLLDGFNPCAMWVLLFLLSLLATLRDRRKMIILAGTFVLVSGLVYFIFMAAWLNVFFVIGYSRFIQFLLGTVAIIMGGIHVKDFVAFQHGFSLSIPEFAKPKLYVRIRRIIQAQQIPSAIIGIIALAAFVNLIELACTAGFPAIYTKILSLQAFPLWKYYGYLGLYNLAYITDDAVMVSLAVATLSHHKLQEREGRWLKLMGGLVMLGLGIFLIVFPEKLF